MKQKKWIAALLSVLLSVCIALVGFFGALELTFFDSGYLIQCMDKVDYIGDISNVIEATCQGYVMSTGLTTVVLDGYLDPSDIQVEVRRAVAERYRGSDTIFYRSHFSDLAERAQALLSPEELEQETQDSLIRFQILQDLCENSFREITRPPFDAALSCMLQYRAYRTWAYLVLLVLSASVYFVLHRAASGKQATGRYTVQAMCGGALALTILGALLLWALPYASWMPSENLSYPLFCMWWSGFASTVLIVGLLMLAAGLILTAWSRMHPKKKPGGSDPQNARPNTGGTGMNTSAGRTINLSHARGADPDSPGASQ